jgi:hypothetical protein
MLLLLLHVPDLMLLFLLLLLRCCHFRLCSGYCFFGVTMSVDNAVSLLPVNVDIVFADAACDGAAVQSRCRSY